MIFFKRHWLTLLCLALNLSGGLVWFFQLDPSPEHLAGTIPFLSHPPEAMTVTLFAAGTLAVLWRDFCRPRPRPSVC